MVVVAQRNVSGGTALDVLIRLAGDNSCKEPCPYNMSTEPTVAALDAAVPPVSGNPAPAGHPMVVHVAPQAPQGVAPPVASKEPNAVVKYWRKVGGGSLALSLLIHVGILVGAYFLVETIVLENKVDFLSGGGSKAGQEASQSLAQQVQQKKRTNISKMLPMRKVVSTSANAAIALPDMPSDNLEMPEMSSMMGGGMTGSAGFGSQGAGGGFGTGIGTGGMKGVTFFGMTTPLDRVVFVLDFSASMKKNQVELVVNEMGKTLKMLPMRSQYQVILFAGGARFADRNWKVEQPSTFERIMVHRGKQKYRFFSPTKSHTDYAFDGSDNELPKDDWLTSNPVNVGRTMEELDKKETWGGTDWRWAFKTALNMSPPPKVVYFMTDGLGGSNVELILDYNKKKAKATLNTFLMHTSAGAPLMKEIAEKTGGRFTIVKNDGATIPGDMYFGNKAKYDKELKE